MALFGDENGNKGIADKINEMYDIFSGAKLAGKIILSIIVVSGGIALAFTQIGTFIVKFLTNTKQ
jgi:hypothetical protein